MKKWNTLTATRTKKKDENNDNGDGDENIGLLDMQFKTTHLQVTSWPNHLEVPAMLSWESERFFARLLQKVGSL